MVLQRHSAEPKHKMAGTRVALLQVYYQLGVLRDLCCAVRSPTQISPPIGPGSRPSSIGSKRWTRDLLVRAEHGERLEPGRSWSFVGQFSVQIMEECGTLAEDLRSAPESEPELVFTEKQKWRLVTGPSTAANSPAISA